MFVVCVHVSEWLCIFSVCVCIPAEVYALLRQLSRAVLWVYLRLILHHLHPLPSVTLLTAVLADHIQLADPVLGRQETTASHKGPGGGGGGGRGSFRVHHQTRDPGDSRDTHAHTHSVGNEQGDTVHGDTHVVFIHVGQGSGSMCGDGCCCVVRADRSLNRDNIPLVYERR